MPAKRSAPRSPFAPPTTPHAQPGAATVRRVPSFELAPLLELPRFRSPPRLISPPLPVPLVPPVPLSEQRPSTHALPLAQVHGAMHIPRLHTCPSEQLTPWHAL